MKVMGWILIKLFVLQCLSILVAASSQPFDFFYFVQQLPAAYCDSGHCCMPTTGIKPSDNFTIHGLWPNYKTGDWPQNCDDIQSPDLNETEIEGLVDSMQEVWPTLACPAADGIKFWSHEWAKHGTCSSLGQRAYFKSALDLHKKADLFQALNNAEITPGNQYSLRSIKQAIEDSTGYAPYVECNFDHHDRMHELFQVYLCVDKSAQEFIECPIFPHGRGCGSTVKFPSFSSSHKYSFESNADL